MGVTNSTGSHRFKNQYEAAMSVVQPTDVTGLDEAILHKHGTYSTALAYGNQSDDHLIIKSMHISASATAKYVFGDINYIETSAASTGWIHVGYNYLSVAHDLVNGYATRGRVAVGAACELGEHAGVLGSMEIGAYAVTANGAAVLTAGLFDLAVTAGATIEQEICCIEVRPRVGANVAGSSCGIRINVNCSVANYVDYGLDIRSMSANQTAAIRILATPASAALATGILFEGQDSSTSVITDALSFAGGVTNVLNFDATDGGSGANTSAACDTDGQNSDGAIRIDVNGTPYYIAIWNADHTSSSW